MKALSTQFREGVETIATEMEKLPWHDAQFYATWLSQTYFTVRQTTRFLCLAAAKTDIANRDKHYEMIHHLKEELSHDVPVLKDLKNLGRDIGEFRELTATRLIVHNQYHWLEQGKVHALSGYALMLEGLSVRIIPMMLEQLKAAGHEKSVAFLKLHLDVDQDHSKSGYDAVDRVPEDQREEILLSLEESRWLYTQMLKQAFEFAQANRKRHALAG